MLPSECEVCLAINRRRPLFGSEEMVEEELMEGLHILAVLVADLRTGERDLLGCLALLVLDLTLSKSDLHVSFS